MNVLSVDPGTKSTGLYLFVDGVGTSVTLLRDPRCDRYENLTVLRNQILGWGRKVNLAVVEDYPYSIPAGQAAYAIEAGAVVREALAEQRIPIVVMPIETWKALTIGRMPKTSKAEKQRYVDQVQLQYGTRFEDVDAADAYLIYKALHSIWTGAARETDTTRRIREQVQVVIEKLEAGMKP